MYIGNRYNKNGKKITIEQIKESPPEFPALVELLNTLYSKHKISTNHNLWYMGLKFKIKYCIIRNNKLVVPFFMLYGGNYEQNKN